MIKNKIKIKNLAPRPSGVRSGEAQMLRTLRFSQLRFRRDVPPCGGMCAALMFRRFNVPAARRRPTFRRWITPGYDPGRDSLFFLFFYFLPRPSGNVPVRSTAHSRLLLHSLYFVLKSADFFVTSLLLKFQQFFNAAAIFGYFSQRFLISG